MHFILFVLVSFAFLNGLNFFNLEINKCYFAFTASTHDQDVFSFYPDERFCNGFVEVLSRYREIVPNLRLAGALSF